MYPTWLWCVFFWHTLKKRGNQGIQDLAIL